MSTVDTAPSRPTRPGVWGRVQTAARSAPPVRGDGVYASIEHLVDPAEFRPKLADDVEVKPFKLKWGNDYVMIANPRELIHYKLDPDDLPYLELMDGTRTVKELVLERFQESGELELTSVADLVSLLHKEGFLAQPYTDTEAAVVKAMNPPPATRRERLNRVAQSMSFEWYGINRFVKWLYDHGLKYLYTPVAQIALAGVAIAGMVAFGFDVHSHKYSLSGNSLALGFLVLLALNYFYVALHELGHALTLVRYGRAVKAFGFDIYFGAPSFYMDSSDGLMLGRKQRMAVSWSGPYAGIILAGLGAILARAFPDVAFSQTLYKFAVLTYFSFFMNIVPFLELDGYWLFSELIQVPDLRPKSIAFLRHDLWYKLRRRERFNRQEVGLALYGVLGTLFTIFAFYQAYFVWKEIFGPLVTRMWNGGSLTRVLLVILAVYVGRPLIKGALNFVRAIGVRFRSLWRKLQFRLETKWRVEAAELIDKLPLFDDVPEEVLSDLAGRVRLRTYPREQAVVRQGDRADAFYVVRKGTLQVIEEDKEASKERVLRVLGRGEAFGELALVQNAKRAATVRAAEDSEVFEIDKGTFDRLLADMIHVPEFAPTLQKVAELGELPCFSTLRPEELSELLEHGEWTTIPPGEVIIRQGEVGDSFYALGSGQVEIEKDGTIVNTLGAGDYFGEVALLLDVPRTATVRTTTPVRAYRLDRQGFDALLADSMRKGTVSLAAADRTDQH